MLILFVVVNVCFLFVVSYFVLVWDIACGRVGFVWLWLLYGSLLFDCCGDCFVVFN